MRGCDIHLCALGWDLPALCCLGTSAKILPHFCCLGLEKKSGERAEGTRRGISVFFISGEENIILNTEEEIAEKHGEGGMKTKVKVRVGASQ